ncbi:hypothetical protein GCM10011506_01730 [Marivirga lumbricoides]|uniref:Uncharacterized protein n=1 Tax=Marivirga lumbricoides TaxID=1046115 RepID=A0ABQ1L7M4_9BACT|nr:hypothetical protein GCM10011506_01730 [Marivirga lumbricoides]
MKRARQLLKWTTLLFFAIALYATTIGQSISIEFAEGHHKHLFYDIFLQGLPIVILLTLLWTIKKRRRRLVNIGIGILTIVAAIGMFFWSILLMYSFSYGAWVNKAIIYRHKRSPEVTISQQLWNIGVFGYAGERTVKLTPFLELWNRVEHIDTTKIDRSEWDVNK